MQGEPIAIVGMAGLFPGSSDLDSFWANVRHGVDASQVVPSGRWPRPPEEVFDPRPGQLDRVYSIRGYFLDPFECDPSGLEIDPALIAELDPVFQLLLNVGSAAFRSARMEGVDRARVGVVVGNIALPTQQISEWAREVLTGGPVRIHPMNRFVPGWTAGLLAKALSLGAGHCTLDAACASSLYALKLACDALSDGRADAMLAGGLNRADSLYTQMGFAQLGALSVSGRCAPLDASADGLMVGEGAGVFVLKRLSDALQHGDTIHGVIRGIGLSNDLYGNLLAPDSEGQLRAMLAAYRQAEWSPTDLDLIECHGTGTPTGDRVELESLRKLWADETVPVVIGSVKSTVGHLLTGAGAAGLAKVLLAIRHGELPPTANFRKPPSEWNDPRFRVLSVAEPWDRRPTRPRRAAVSAFGFGGINAHVLIEEWNEHGTYVQPSILPVSREPIAIVGMAAHFGSCPDLKTFARRTLRITQTNHELEITELDFPLDRFRIPPREVEQTLPQQLLTLQVVADARADRRSTHEPAPERQGAFVGVSLDLNTTNYHLRWTASVASDEVPPLTPDRVMGSLASIAASRLARAFAIGGPCFTLSAEEASVGVALDKAITALQRRELDQAVVAAVDFARDPRAMAAVDHDQIGEGAGAVILKRLSDAERDGDRIYACITESGEVAFHATPASVGVGICGAAAMMPALIQAALALHHQLTPDGFWLVDDADGPRRAAVSVDHHDGNALRFTLEEHLASRHHDRDDLREPHNESIPVPDRPRNPLGQIAFVYPGSGNHFPGMGRDWATLFPQVMRRQQLENRQLRSQYRPDLFWCPEFPPEVTPRDFLFGQVTLGTLITDALLELGIRPDASIGYSLGESSALFALRAWRDRDEMLNRVQRSSLFVSDLAGSYDSVRRAWNRSADEPIDWFIVLVRVSAATVRATLKPSMKAYLLIINTPDECIVGGQREDVERLVNELGTIALPLEGVTVAHCECLRPVAEPYRDLHHLPVTPPEEIRFYSGAWGRSYELDSDSAADAILASGLDAVDFPALIERAYQDGVRVFLEIGPGASCTRMISTILRDRHHFAIPLCARGRHAAEVLPRVIGHLAKYGYSIPTPRPPRPLSSSAQRRPMIRIPAHAPFVTAPAKPMSLSLDYPLCLEFARGSIAPVLGDRFREVDSYPTRVRLPDEPLMLVDRITHVEGEPLSLKTGRVVTEHDVRADRWYLEGDRAPACVAIESGQADLFLSAYLGIDFHTKGKACYRLLDAAVTFHRGLPRVGETLRYDIHIDQFFRQGDMHLFRFRFEGFANDEPLLTMRDGCAGFFTEAELAAGKGIVERKQLIEPVGRKPEGWRPLAPVTGVESYSDEQVEALRTGDFGTAFGSAFAGLSVGEVKPLPGGMMRMVHRVPLLDPMGGKFGLGMIRAEADVQPDDWYLTCHFVDDMVMPGTLMYECTLHTLRVLLMRLGWVPTGAGMAWEPRIGVAARLRCRGQVVTTTRTVAYEVIIKEVGYGPEPFAIADAYMYADSRRVVEVTDISLQLTGSNREQVEQLWARAGDGHLSSVGGATRSFTREQVYAFAIGKPSECFGPEYARFDTGFPLARLPGPPYAFLDRITHAEPEPFRLEAGGGVVAEYDVPPEAWYFAQNRSSHMPFAVLLEIALQPCGFLSAYMGSALSSDAPLSYRNLGGKATLKRPIGPDVGPLTISATCTKVSRSAGMIIQNFDFAVRSRTELLYEGDTYFGFFPPESLAKQVGITDVTWPEMTDESETEKLPEVAPFPGAGWRMIDTIDRYSPNGGRHGLGAVQGSIDVDPSMWFFRAHFFGDPVWPGSLGLESMLQLMKWIAHRRWGNPGPDGWLTVVPGHEHSWTYRGQVIPGHRTVRVSAEVSAFDDERREMIADGLLQVDGRVIYRMEGFSLRG